MNDSFCNDNCVDNDCCCHCFICPPARAGKRGLPGPFGIAGEQGLSGEAGARGPKGYAGAQGTAGPEGPAGQKGIDGTLTGPVGLKGPDGPAGPAGPAGAEGPRGSVGEQGISPTELYAHFYALDQTLAEGGRVSFLPGPVTGVASLSADSKQIRVNQPGAYLIHTAWTAEGDGAVSMLFALNGMKIPHMNYFKGSAVDSLTSVTPGYIILWLNGGENLSVVGYAPQSTLAVPKNNTYAASPGNSAATVTLFKLSNFHG